MLLFNTTKFGVICYTAITSCLYPKWRSGELLQQNIKYMVMTLRLGGWRVKVGRALKRLLAEADGLRGGC